MKKNKNEDLLKKAMGDFKKHKGGTEVEKEFTEAPETIGVKLQSSFDKIFPELIKKQKCRKHIIFDEDVFEAYEGLSKTQGCSLSALVNSALRNYANEKFSTISLNSKNETDIYKELLENKKREIELRAILLNRRPEDKLFDTLFGSVDFGQAVESNESYAETGTGGRRKA